MINSKNVFLSCLLISLVSCQSPVVRMPSSVMASKDWEELRDLKQRKVELGALSVHHNKKGNESELLKLRSEEKIIDEKIKHIELKLTVFDQAQSKLINNVRPDWRIEKERIELSDIDLYSENKNVQFSFSTYEAKETMINLTHKFFTKQGYSDSQNDKKKPTMDFTAHCDAPVILKYGLGSKKVKANELFHFSLGDKKISNDFRDLIVKSDLNSCDFKFTSSLVDKGEAYSFKLVNESKKVDALKKLTSTAEVCSTKKDSGKFFETSEFSSMSCPAKYESLDILPEPIDSLNARVKSLLGQDLPADFIKNGNPFAELDFSKAPKFDAILVSYLVFRADFYGTLLGRLLAYHADRGTLVRAIVSEVISLEKDEMMYERLMAKHPNIKFIKYKFDNQQQGGAWISELHRTNHVKLFIAYSKENPEDSLVIVGGKNIHDGFVFKTPVDVSKYPDVVNYVSGDESWAYWRDFEMVIKGQEIVEAITRHYMSFYHVNKENLVKKVTSITVEKDSAAPAETETMRHYISIPFKDEPNLNLFYARLLDSAKKKILISSPYFRPVKEIQEALDRAIARGVDVSIITRLDLEGDTADFILGAVNKDGVNKFLKKVKVYEYIEPKVILHSKLLMIDEEVTFISSVNLNKRSFYHDLENGVVVNDPAFTKKMGKLYSEYLKICKQLTEEQSIVFWKRWIIQIFDKVL